MAETHATSTTDDIRWQKWARKVDETVHYLENQKYPVNMTKEDKRVLRRSAKSFTLSADGKSLVYTLRNSKRAVLKTRIDCLAVFQQFHASPIGGHSGINKTTDSICSRFYWPGQTDDIKSWITSCDRCQRVGPLEKAAPLHPIKVIGPWQMLGVDLVGPLTTTRSGNKYIFTATDYYTKWVEAFAIPDKRASSVAFCMLEIFYWHGASHSILTDQGREFVNQVNEELCNKLDIVHKVTAAYHPQTNGLDEKTNHSIKRALRKLVSEKGDDWDTYLGPVLFSLRSKKHMTTQYSPFRLLYNREAVYPSELPDLNSMIDVQLPSCQPDGIGEAQAKSEKQTAELQDEALANIKAAQEKQSKYYNRKANKRRSSIEIDSIVLRYNAKKKARKGGPLEPDYLGPYRVAGIDGKKCQLADLKGKLLKTKYSLDHLKLYKDPSLLAAADVGANVEVPQTTDDTSDLPSTGKDTVAVDLDESHTLAPASTDHIYTTPDPPSLDHYLV